MVIIMHIHVSDNRKICGIVALKSCQCVKKERKNVRKLEKINCEKEAIYLDSDLQGLLPYNYSLTDTSP